MNNKPKINDVAKDFEMSSQELIDFFSEKNITKKATAVLDADEMTMLVETLSQKNQVDSFNDYFATAANKKEVKKEY